MPHCIENTEGWQLNPKVKVALNKKRHKIIQKMTFGSVDLPSVIAGKLGWVDLDIELVGLCTDICVVSNALILKAYFKEANMTVDASCCAGVTVEKHKAALETMKSCQINVINE